MDSVVNSISLPPFDVIIGLICVFVFGTILGAMICLPLVQRNSEIPLEKLSNDIIWKYTPDWVLMMVGCIIFLVLSFILISGLWRI